jgi:hypothetical protein
MDGSFSSCLFTAVKARASTIELSPSLSIVIGVCTALLIVTVVILLVRVYCTRRRSGRDRRRQDKAAIPLNKDAPDGCDADEKNPDVIPQGELIIYDVVNKGGDDGVNSVQ